MTRTLEILDSLHGDGCGSEVEMTPAEAEFIRRWTAKYCVSRENMRERLEKWLTERQKAMFEESEGEMRLAAAARGAQAKPQAIKTPDETVTFVFSSLDGTDDAGKWRAEITVPPMTSIDSSLSVTVCDCAGERVEEGVLRLAGISLPLKRGAAEMPFGLFLAGIRDTDVHLTRNGAQVKGALAFF